MFVCLEQTDQARPPRPQRPPPPHPSKLQRSTQPVSTCRWPLSCHPELKYSPLTWRLHWSLLYLCSAGHCLCACVCIYMSVWSNFSSYSTDKCSLTHMNEFIMCVCTYFPTAQTFFLWFQSLLRVWHLLFFFYFKLYLFKGSLKCLEISIELGRQGRT